MDTPKPIVDALRKGNSVWLITLATVLGLSPPLFADSESLPPETNESVNWDKEREFWSFRAPMAQSRPLIQNQSWPRQPLDYFVLNRLEQNKLAPSAEADRRTLVRRLTFDLTGLPPTPEEVEAFVTDQLPGAYDRLVERLLASPRFGERMAGLWLPLARYAEDQAHQVGSDTTMFYPNAFRYREWAIDAFNHDLPYDQFIRLQLAADKIPDGADHLAALGFLGLGPKYYGRGSVSVMADEWEDRIDAVTRTMQGLTVACARCHDHKFDPITTQDYYALAGVFASTKMVNRAGGGTNLESKVNADKMPPETLHIVEDGEVKDLNVFIRGNADSKGPSVERRFLRVLSPANPEPFHEGSGRKELAEAIASRSNPLTARVMVNRVWEVFFGRALVPTPSNFGHSGMPPTHPRLLDDLAVRFMEQGWSIKNLAREIALSSAYRQASSSEKTTLDPANTLLGRMNRRRLSIEQWRDAVLFVSGQLANEGGKSLEVDDPQNRRRTVYARISRLKLNDVLMQFDYPDANVHAEHRGTTTTATQKLFMLNSVFMAEQAKALAAQLSAVSSEDATRIESAYRRLFGRAPAPEETKLGLEFLKQPSSEKLSAWAQYAQLLMASNEMLYVD